MQKLHKYELIIDDGATLFKLCIPAFDETEAAEHANGAGEIVRVKEISDYLPSATRKDALLFCESPYFWPCPCDY